MEDAKQMLHVQSRRGNRREYFFALSESNHIVAANFCSISCTMGDAFFCERGALKLEWLLGWQKKERGLESCSSTIFWSIWRERNWRAFKDRKSLNQTIKTSFLYLFSDWVRVYMGDNVTSLIDFVDWLSCP